MKQLWRETWLSIKRHGVTLLGLVLTVMGPLLILNAIAVTWLGIAPDDADKGMGLVNVLLMPVLNGGVVWLVHRGRTGQPATLGGALRACGGCWSRLFVAYVGVSLIMLAWLVATVLPAYILLMILKVQQPLLLIPFGIAGLLLGLPRFAFIDPLVVLEGLSPFYARHRSAELVKPRRWTVIGYGLTAYALPLALEIAGEFLPDRLGLDQRTTGLGVGMALSLLSSVLYLVPIVFFYTYYRAVVPNLPAATEPKELP